MFDNIGKKIKGLASFITTVGIFVSVVTMLGLLSVSRAGIAILIGIAGSLISWLSSFLLYGYGELIDKTCSIDKSLSTIDKQLKFLSRPKISEDLHETQE